MKNILLSLKPEQVANVLNGNQTIIVRKKFPKDYVGWVYIYCSKDKHKLLQLNNYGKWDIYAIGDELNGKVVARFWCDNNADINKESCLTNKQLKNYIGYGDGYAIHISKLEVFEKPRELNEFYLGCRYYSNECENTNKYCLKYKRYNVCEVAKNLTKAPQNYCYIIGEEK